MNQYTRKNETSNGAIKRVKQSGKCWFDRSNSNRWHVMRGDTIIFGGGHVRRNLEECREFVKGYES
jgi:hypothetical protein